MYPVGRDAGGVSTGDVTRAGSFLWKSEASWLFMGELALLLDWIDVS